MQDLGETRDEALAVRLVHSVLHAVVDQLSLRRRLAEGSGQESHALQVVNDILLLVCSGQDASCTCCADLELWDDGNGLDLLGPREANVSADVVRGDWGLKTSVLATLRRGKNLSQRNLLALHVFRVELLEAP